MAMLLLLMANLLAMRVFHVMRHWGGDVGWDGGGQSMRVDILPKTEFEKHIFPVMCIEFGWMMGTRREVTTRIMNRSCRLSGYMIIWVSCLGIKILVIWMCRQMGRGRKVEVLLRLFT